MYCNPRRYCLSEIVKLEAEHAAPKRYVDERYVSVVEQLSEERAQMTELKSLLAKAGLLNLPFNSTGWTHTAHILGISVVNSSSYTKGLGTIGNKSGSFPARI